MFSPFVTLSVGLKLHFLELGQRCRKDSPHWSHLSGGTEITRGVLARTQEEH